MKISALLMMTGLTHTLSRTLLLGVVGLLFKLKPLTGQALVKAKKAAEKFQAAPATTLQKDRFRLSQAKSFAKAKAKAIPKPALSDAPSSSHQAPPAQPIVSNPGVSSRGTEMQIEPPQKIDRKHMVTTKEGEKVIMNQLRLDPRVQS